MIYESSKKKKRDPLSRHFTLGSNCLHSLVGASSYRSLATTTVFQKYRTSAAKTRSEIIL